MSSRLMLVADDPLSASALRRALRAASAFEVFDGYVDGAASCAATMAAHGPDVVVVDQMRSRDDTIARIAEIHGVLPAARSSCSRTRPARVLTAAAAAGADAAIAKTFRLDGIGDWSARSPRQRVPCVPGHAGAAPAEHGIAPVGAELTASSRSPPGRRRRAQQPDRGATLDHRADRQVPPLERVSEARGVEPDPRRATSPMSTGCSRCPHRRRGLSQGLARPGR